MNIAVYHDIPEGGAKIALFHQLKWLAKNNQLVLYAHQPETGEYDLTPICKKVVYLPYDTIQNRPNLGFKRLKNDIFVFFTLSKIIRHFAHQIDSNHHDLVFVYHSHLTQAPYILKYLKTKSVYFCHEPLRQVYESEIGALQKTNNQLKNIYSYITNQFRKRIDNKNARYAGKIFTSSKYLANYIKKTYNRSSTIIPLGIDTKSFIPATSFTKKKNLLFIGEQNQLNGFLFVQKIIEKIPKNLYQKFLIISPKNQQFKQSQAEIVKAYQSSFVTFCCASREPFGLVSLESQACATPVLAVNEAGYQETIINGKTGFLLDRNEKQFIQIIIKLAKDIELVKNIGQQARNEIETHWTWQARGKQLEDELRKYNRQP